MNSQARSPVEEARYAELLWPVVPTGQVDGALDWFCGVMALDVSHVTWENLASMPPEVQAHAWQVYGHELFHFVQLVTMGFMHDWAADLFGLVRPAVLREQRGAHYSDYSGLKRIIELGPQLLSPVEAESVAGHFLKLDEPGTSGLTTRAILESHAHFAERRLNHHITESSHWTSHLHDAPSPMYRVAFDFLAFAVGYEPAFHWFSLVASLSLCTSSPIDTFERLTLVLVDDEAARALTSDAEADVSAMVEFALSHLSDTAVFTPLNGTEKEHPVFTPVAYTLAAAANEGKFDVFRCYARPDREIIPLLEHRLVRVPILFKPAPPSRLAIQSVQGVPDHVIVAMFILGAIGRQLTRTAETAALATGDASIARLAWLIRDHTPAFCDLAGDDLESGDPARMLHLFDPRRGNTLAAWGRIVLRVPPEVDPTQDVLLYRVPAARRLLRAIHRHMPSFIMYLSVPYGPYEWFGCIEHDSNREEPDWLSPRIYALIAEAETAIYTHGESVGQNAWLAVQCLFRPWTRARK